MLKWEKLHVSHIQPLLFPVHRHDHISPFLTALPCKEAQLIVHNAVCILLRNPCTVRFLNLLISHLPELFQRAVETEPVPLPALCISQIQVQCQVL